MIIIDFLYRYEKFKIWLKNKIIFCVFIIQNIFEISNNKILIFAKRKYDYMAYILTRISYLPYSTSSPTFVCILLLRNIIWAIKKIRNISHISTINIKFSNYYIKSWKGVFWYFLNFKIIFVFLTNTLIKKENWIVKL